MIFLFPRWDMLIPWRVIFRAVVVLFLWPDEFNDPTSSLARAAACRVSRARRAARSAKASVFFVFLSKRSSGVKDQPPVWFVGFGLLVLGCLFWVVGLVCWFGLLVLAMVCWFWVVCFGLVWVLLKTTSERVKWKNNKELRVCFSRRNKPKKQKTRNYPETTLTKQNNSKKSNTIKTKPCTLCPFHKLCAEAPKKFIRGPT